ncbi:MAG: MotA/TolQ/ExbB proton channel family protein [Lentisphaerae bacterium]|nr:MotA/TolQ/ExbB proton channel family protein [Lentisphaerota bacterium]
MNKMFDTAQMDCEERLGFAAGDLTAVRKISALVPGVILTSVVYGVLSLLKTAFPQNDMIKMFFPYGEADRTFIPLITVFFAMWCLVMLIMKKKKLSVQKKLLKALEECGSVPEKERFIAENVERPSEFAAAGLFLLERELEKRHITPAEKDVILSGAAGEYEKISDTSFIPVSTLIWAIPVLGFIGTVLGLAKAVSQFGSLANTGDGASFNAVLPQVTGGLATAFETTLIALVLALILQMIAAGRRQDEELFFGSLKSRITSGSQDSVIQ